MTAATTRRRRSLPILVLLALGFAAGAPPGVASTGPWTISRETVFPGGRTANPYVDRLLERLAAADGPGLPVGADEFLRLCERAPAEAYVDELVKYGSPRSVQIQKREHADYSRVFMKEERQRAGVDFLHRHDRLLRSASARYGVARQDIVSILMWESGLGEFVGDLRVFNIFLGQILYLPQARDLAVARLRSRGEWDPARWQPRAEQDRRLDRIRDRAVENLAALVRMAKQKGIDPTAQVGSWGGALGYPQFMPASLVFAVDGDGDGSIDLNTWPDAIFSVARYLAEHGYGMDYPSRRKGIHAYNPISSYVDGVIRYADAIWARYRNTG